MYKLVQKQILLVFLGLCVTIIAQSAKSTINISVTADHADWVYKLNEKVKFKILITKGGEILDNIKISYEIGPEKMTYHIKDTLILKNGKIEIVAGTMNEPGFLRCKVKADYENVNYEGLATAAFEPEKIEPTTTLPDDFKSFWEKEITDNSKNPLDAKITLLPEQCTEKVNVFNVNFQNGRVGMRVYGILCIPKATGKYPAVLKVPGAGVGPLKGEVKMAERGIITLQIGIHGIPVILDSIIYANLKYGALTNYQIINLDNKDTYYYKHVYLGCIRAIDFINTLPEYDGESLAVWGGSQGGALSIVAAALDNRVKCICCFFPALSDMTGYLNGRAGGWPHMFSNIKNATKEKVETTKYYDVANFAKFISVPGYYSFGFNDETCPPTSMYAAFNGIKSSKTFFIVKESGHFTVAEQIKKSYEFLLMQLNVQPLF
jgi:cephalosporin-C deacetylase-like acetyl esterase